LPSLVASLVLNVGRTPLSGKFDFKGVNEAD